MSNDSTPAVNVRVQVRRSARPSTPVPLDLRSPSGRPLPY
jgi:hypothetical protein